MRGRLNMIDAINKNLTKKVIRKNDNIKATKAKGKTIIDMNRRISKSIKSTAKMKDPLEEA